MVVLSKAGVCTLDEFTVERTMRSYLNKHVEKDPASPYYGQFAPEAGMDVQCVHCGAKRYKEEPSGICCSNGKVSLPLIPNQPDQLRSLIVGDQDFRQKIRKYNQALAFTSMAANVDLDLANQRDGVYTFRVQGQLSHRIGSLLPEPDHEHKFVQIYFVDQEAQVDRRLGIFPDLSPDALSTVTELMELHNPYVQTLRSAREILAANAAANGGNGADLRVAFRAEGVDLRRYNAPTSSEVAAILQDNEEPRPRDIVLHGRAGPLKRISELHKCYDPCSYPLLLPYGTDGWHPGMRLTNGKQLTLRQKCAFDLMIREENRESNPLHLGGRLLQQYVTDQYCKIEGNRLDYIRQNQDAIRAEKYSSLLDVLNSRAGSGDCAQRIGRHIVLPSSFTNSARHMQQIYQDSMSVVRRFGKPDLFTTITCNPVWPEIARDLLPGQKPADRPDLTSRAFNRRLKFILEDIEKGKCFGSLKARVHSIEFQKRGLPHCHLLLWIEEEDKPRCSDDYDKFISAELPCPDTQPELYKIVTSGMIHGPCGVLNQSAPCMKDGKCSKGYPKEFRERTAQNEDGYPVYRRRDNGRVFRTHRGMVLDNRWVVPYSPYLFMKYNCHINVEVCSTVKAVKYLHKYVFKGPDRACVRVEAGERVVDEIKDYLDGRWVSPNEACWRIFGFGMHGSLHSVVRLPVHLPGQQQVYFEENAGSVEELEKILGGKEHTMLTRFFDLCAADEYARGFTYHELPEHYSWNKQTKQWKRRSRRQRVIGRMYTVSPSHEGRYFLRMLLTKVKGPVSFNDLLTFEGRQYESYRAVCAARGYLQDDNEWRESMREAAVSASPRQLRSLFTSMLLFSHPSEPGALWDEFRCDLTEDFLSSNDNDENRAFFLAASEIDRALRRNGKRWQEISGLPAFPEPPRSPVCRPGNPNILVAEETSYDPEMLREDAAKVDDLHQDQLLVFHEIVDSVYGRSDHSVFFLKGAAGFGKTFLYSAVAGKLRSDGKIVLMVASSGIASLLLPGGRTAHSRFRLPLNLIAQSTCNIAVNSELGELLRLTDLIIWDEAPMVHRYAFEALSRTLCDIRDCERPMGGIVTVLGGDFRQILPVVLKGTRGQIVNACIRRSPLWSSVKCLELTENKRVNPNEREFASWLLDVGEGKLGEKIAVPDDMKLQDSSLGALVEDTFPAFEEHYLDVEYIKGKVILATTNTDVDMINAIVSQRIPANVPSREYLSADSIGEDEDVAHGQYPEEFLNSLSVNGIAPHRLKLCNGMVIMLLRNMDKKLGLCNGSRLIVRQLQPHVIEAEVITGQHAGKRVFIPRIDMSPANTTLPFTLIRRQFPVRPAYAMTINKSQGQTLSKVGLCLLNQVFTHGQLYVALSRVRRTSDIRILLPNGCSHCQNVVYKEIFA